jgi:hypothetical protein
MQDYQALDLSASCNAGWDMLGADQELPVGHQLFRGLPFLIGRDRSRCLIALDATTATVNVHVGQTAKRVIFAHRLLESEVPEGGMLGRPVAEYVFHFANGDELPVPIRERFEVEFAGGGLAFAATSDQNDTLLPRYEGRWDSLGYRQTEATRRGGPHRLRLWVWENPRPDLHIDSVAIVPKGPRFILAAVTLGHLDEHPFVRKAKREIGIVLTEPSDAQRSFDLSVDVDRGVATYPHALPQASADEFLRDSFKGWGEAQNQQSSPAYVEIAAVPSATITVKQGQEEVGSLTWGDLEEKGAVSTPRLRAELLDRGRNWVHVTVLDDVTGRPVPCRVHFRSPEGIPYQPHGHHNQVNSNLGTWHIDVGGDVRLGQITYAYIDGTCQGWLPRGDVIVDVARGFEYEPLRTKVTIEPGQRELTLRLKRWINMNAQRWFSGDSHVHFLSAQGAHLEFQAEDLNVVNLLQSQWGSLFTNTEEFTGGPSISRHGDSIVYVSQENRQHFLGHLILWGLRRPVMPWCSDGLSEAELAGTMETTLSHWADEAHAQGGTVIVPHFPSPNGEPAALIATGRADGIEMITQSDFSHLEYYRYLNGGYRLPLVGGTDKMTNEVPVGMYRTYVNIPREEEFNYDNWRKNVALGRTFLSGGPIIGFSVEGRQVGDTVRLSGSGTVEVEAWAESVLPICTLQVVQEGRVVASTEERNGTRRLTLKAKIQVTGHSWLAARCGGPGYKGIAHHDVWNRGIFAHTSPVYVAVGGDWRMFNSDTARYMLTLIEGSMTYIREVAAVHRDAEVTHHHGEADHLAYLQRPFLAAQAAVQRRIEQSQTKG